MINYTPKPDTGKAIFDVSVTFKNGSFKGIRSSKYKYDICKPDTTNKVEREADNDQVTIVDLDERLTIKDQDTKEYWVIDYNEVREVRTKTAKMILPDKEEE